MQLPPEIAPYRKTDYPVDPLILSRWSARAMSGKAVTPQEVGSLFDAARWAPSSYNNQPWRFLYALRDTPDWDLFFSFLVPFNQKWCALGALLGVILSKNTFDKSGKPSRTHSFDTGAAWHNISLQGTAMGLVVHGMEGFDYDLAKERLNVPDGCTVEAMFVVGRKGDPAQLPEEIRAKEAPGPRKPLAEIAAAGAFPWRG
jgi:nitroreductase